MSLLKFPEFKIPSSDLTSWKWILNKSKEQIHYREKHDPKKYLQFLSHYSSFVQL